MLIDEKVEKYLDIDVTLVQLGSSWKMSQSIILSPLLPLKGLKDMITSLGDCSVDGVTYKFYVKRSTRKKVNKKIKYEEKRNDYL